MSSVINVTARLKADIGSYTAGMDAARKATENFTKSAQQGSDQTEKHVKGSFDSIGRSALKLGTLVKGAVVGFVAIQGQQFLKGAIQSASNFEAEFEGVNQMFGDGAKKVQDFAKNAAVTAGIAENSALRFAKSFGGYAKSAGLAGDAQSDFSTKMVQAAGDLGSFFDLPTESALMAIQQGLRGEYEPLRRFNILLDENSIGQAAMAMGISKTGKNLTQQQKIMVRQKSIMDQMGVAQGDFVKYGDTYGNQIKTTSALFQNLQKDVGGALLPAMAKLAAAAVPLIQVLGPLLTDAVKALNPVIEAVTLAMGGLEPVMKPIFDILKVLAEVFANIVSAILPPLLALLAPLLSLFSSLAAPLATLVNGLLPSLSSILTALLPAWELIFSSVQKLMPVFTQLGTLIANAFTKLLPSIGMFIDALMGLWQSLGPVLDTVVQIALDAMPMLMDAFISVINAVTPLIPIVFELVDALLPLIPPILSLVTSILPPFIDLFMTLMPILSKIAQIILKLLIPVLKFLVPILGAIIQKVGEFVAKVVTDIKGFIDWLYPYIEPILNGIIDGINSVLSAMGQATLPKLPKSSITAAFKQGKAIGEAKIAGEKAVTASSVRVPALTTLGVGGGQTQGGSGSKAQAKKNPVAEFYKKMGNEAKQQTARLKLISMGLNEDLANQVVSAGEGWEKIYSQIVKGGSKAITGLESKFAQTAAGIAKVGDVVKNTMQSIQQSIMSGFDVSKMGRSSANVIANARRLVDKAKEFGAEIVGLSQKNLNPMLLNQIIAAGPVEGLALAKSLNAGGDIPELNSLYNQLGDTALATGRAVATNQTTFSFQVSGGVGDKNSIGKAIVEAIKTYERQSTASWRTP